MYFYVHTLIPVNSIFVNLECPKRSFRLRLGRRFLETINAFFTTKNLQLVYPPLWQGPFNENPYTKLRLGRSKARALASVAYGAADRVESLGLVCAAVARAAER